MSVPGFQTWFMPLLKQLKNGETHSISNLYTILADELKLTEEERLEKIPSGKQLIFKNRIGWARTYLNKAGLVESQSRGNWKITPQGLSILKNPPEQLNIKFLKQYPEFQKFHSTSNKVALPDQETETENETPEELLGRVHQNIRKQFTFDLLDRIKAAPPAFFENLVVDLLVNMGYGGSREDAGKTVGGSGDGGIDGIINEDRLGLDIICIQAKRWEGSVGRPVVQAFAGSLEGFRAKKGVLITTSTFTKNALEYVKQIEKRIILIDGNQLAKLMVEHQLGVTPVAKYELHKIDIDYFEEE